MHVPTRQPFRLLWRFGLLAALAIGAIALLNTWAIGRFLERQLFQREADLSRDFVLNVLQADGSMPMFRGDSSPAVRQRFEGSMRHLTELRDVLRANVYTRSRQLMWSSHPELIGHFFPENDELDAALAGELVVHAGRLSMASKHEHQGLGPRAEHFVETYIPVLDGDRVVAVVELYKAPAALSQALRDGHREVAVSAALGALLLAGLLGGLVWRADRLLRRQHTQLAEAQTSLALNELAASVAHNIRNPLASIRSSAELALVSPHEPASGWAQDILHDADRIRDRIDALLRLGMATPPPTVASPEPVLPLLQACVADQRPRFERRGQQLSLQWSEDVARARLRGGSRGLGEALESLLSNASEAMPDGGHCALSLACGPRPGWLRLVVHDDGPGLAPQQLEAMQRPFVSGKPQGLGLGLPLARSAVERMGGRFMLSSEPGHGTMATLDLPSA